MKRFTVLFSISIISAFLLTACQPDRSVHAGNEEYKPRPAPSANVKNELWVRGELIRVDQKDKMVSVRLDNGRLQTLKFNDCTEVDGLQDQQQNMSKSGASLIGKEGSEVSIQLGKANGEKIALVIDVTPGGSTNDTDRD